MTRRIAWILILFVSATLFAQVPVQIRSSTVKARTRPSGNAGVIATLHAGDVFVIKDDKPYWYEIVLHDGKFAWVPKASCTVVDPKPSDDSGDVLNPPAPVSPGDHTSVTVPSCVETSVPADWSTCPATGSGGMYAKAYVQKNRLQVPCTYMPMTVDDMLALEPLPKSVRALPDTDAQSLYLKSEEAKAVMLEGFLALVKDGGKEGVNCNSGTRLDTHMEIVDTDTQDPKTNRDRHVVAEVTPWFSEAVPDWSVENLKQYASYVSDYRANTEKEAPTRIRVYGYLFFDEAHASGATTWRGSAWEVHPITRIEVFVDGSWEQIGSIQ